MGRGSIPKNRGIPETEKFLNVQTQCQSEGHPSDGAGPVHRLLAGDFGFRAMGLLCRVRVLGFSSGFSAVGLWFTWSINCFCKRMEPSCKAIWVIPITTLTTAIKGGSASGCQQRVVPVLSWLGMLRNIRAIYTTSNYERPTRYHCRIAIKLLHFTVLGYEGTMREVVNSLALYESLYIAINSSYDAPENPTSFNMM